MPYSKIRYFGCSYASFLRALKDGVDRESEKYCIHIRADDQLFVVHREPPRDARDAIVTFSLSVKFATIKSAGDFKDHREIHPRQSGDFDLRSTDRKTVVFAHQRLDVSNDHGVRNCPEVRRVLQDSGKVLAVLQQYFIDRHSMIDF